MSSPLALLLLAGGVLSPATPSAPFGLALQEEVLPRAVGREIALRAAAPTPIHCSAHPLRSASRAVSGVMDTR